MAQVSWIVIAIVALTLSRQTDGPSATVFEGKQVEIITPQVDSIGSALASARVCLRSADQSQCYTPPKGILFFGLEPHATIIKLAVGDQALLFTAVASGGGSGTQKVLALLKPGKGHDLDNLLPKGLTVSEQGEYQFWSEASISPKLLLVTANYVWNAGETHFSRHKFQVSTYVFSFSTQGYQLRDRYVTAKKYPGLDDTDDIHVLAFEKARILLHLKRRK